MKINQLIKTKEEFRPLYKKGEIFKIIEINNHPDLLPIRAVNKYGDKYGFEYSEVIEL